MGMRFRKSINLGGGTKLNISKSGVGISTGVKGFRVSNNTSGRSRVTASIPGTGISYAKEIGSGSSAHKSSGKTTAGVSATNSGTPGGGDKPPFFQRKWVIIALMFLLAPLGIFLAWRYMPTWKRGTKIAMSVFCGLIWLLAIFPGGSNSSDTGKDVTEPPAIVDKTEQNDAIVSDDADKSDNTQQSGNETAGDIDQQTAVHGSSITPPEVTDSGSSQSSSGGQGSVSQEDQDTGNQQQTPAQDRTVYITPTGTKYHRSGCSRLKGDKTEILLSDAIARGYEACGVCGG